MSEFTLKPAKKEKIPGLFSLWGKSGSGKTYSALLLARGLVGPKGKIAVIDTENHRAKFYSDVAGGWMHCDMQAPFSAERYVEAFQACEKQGADVVIVDSMSHVWESTLEQADNATTASGKEMYGLARWKAPKTAHKRMTNTLIRSSIPVIFCIRAKDGVKQIGKGKDMEIIPIGLQPISERNFIYEMTLDLHMTKDGHYDLGLSKTIPAALRDVIKPDGVVNEAMGAAIAHWAGSGITLDEEYQALKRSGTEAATQGVESYKKWLAGLNKDQKEKVKNSHTEWSNLAKQADAEKSSQEYVIEDGKAASGN